MALAAGSNLGADTYPRQPGIDARHYAVRLTLLTSDSNEIQAEATVTLRVVTPGTREAILDLTSATPDGKGMTVTSVTSDGRAVPIEHRDNRLHLPLPAGATAGQDVVFTIALPRRPRPTACASSTTSTAIARPSARTGTTARASGCR